MSLSLENEFKDKLLRQEDQYIFRCSDYSYNVKEALVYYDCIFKSHVSKKRKIIIICNTSLESHLISFFSILSHHECFLVGEEITEKDLLHIYNEYSIEIIVKPEYFHIDSMNAEIIDYSGKFNILVNEIIINNKTCQSYIEKHFSKKVEKTIFMSSGSTGKAKLIPLTYGNIDSCYQSVCKGFMNTLNYETILSPNDTSFVSILPHLFAFTYRKKSSIFASPYNYKTSALLLISSEIKKQTSACLLILVPSVIKLIIGLIKNNKNETLKNISIISAGEPLTYELAKSLLDNNIVNFFNLYGSTEVSPWIFYLNIKEYIKNNKNKEELILPIGKPLPEVKCFIDKNKELLVSAKNVFNGYLNYNNTNIFIYKDKNKYFKLGDYARIENKVYYCEGRINGAIKIAGTFINPMLLEVRIKDEFKIDNVIILGDSRNSCIFAILFEEAKNDFTKKIKKFIHTNISSKIPVKILVSDKKPKFLRSGKINRIYYKNEYIK